jgi:ureidoacrylate peracid hydrolase
MTDPLIPAEVLQAVIARYGTAHVHADFDPAKSALIVVDMQQAFLRPEFGYVACPAALDTIPHINALAVAVREAGGTVVWLKNIHDADTEASWSVMTGMAGQVANERRAASLAIDAPGFALDPALDVAPDDPVVVKRRYSAFLQGSSNLEEILRARGIDTLIMTGCTTDVCVESTSRDGMMCNFKVIVVSDATAALSRQMHAGALSGLYFHFADVMPTAMVLERIATA